MENPEGLTPPSPDRLTAADRDRFRAEYEAAARARRAMMALQAPLWRRVLARWIAAAKRRMQNRI